MSTVISVENLSKSYRLGQINTGTFTYDLQLWWAKVRGKPHPWQTIGEPDERHRDGEIVWALQDVSFKVEQGEILGIIGRNGAGKSTLLKILSRVTAPTSGIVKIKGRIASLLEVGTGFHPDLTGRENVYLNGAIMGMDRQEVTSKFDEIVDFSGVEQFIDTPVKRYSSGMYVRLAFAVAAHLEPEILVVDEVLAVGDAEFQKKCLGKMGDVAKGGRTVLFVSHNMGAIRTLGKSGLMLRNGHASCYDKIDDCINDYLHTETQSDLPQIFLPERADVPLYITSMKVVNQRGEITKQFSYDEPVEIRANIKVMQPVSRLYMALHVLDNEQQTLLFSRNFESNIEELSRNWQPNEYLYRVVIPQSLLTPGDYRLNFHIASSIPAKVINGVDGVCPFQIIDNGSIRSQTGFPWVGKVGFFPNWVLEEASPQSMSQGAGYVISENE
jgi:lipopolysaccharide transport system ATP-binding protein